MRTFNLTDNEMSILEAGLSTLQDAVGCWSAYNFPQNQPHMPLLGAAEEIGELCHAHLKLEQGIRGTPDEHKLAKADAIGDVLIYLCDYCERNQISLATAVRMALDEVLARDWQTYPKNGRTE